MNFHIISIFPETLKPYLNSSILKKAQEKKKIKIFFHNPIDFLEKSKSGLSKRVDDKPYGGGPGMVLKAEPFLKSIKKAIGRKKDFQIIYFSPSAKKWTNKEAIKISKNFKNKKIKNLILVCGRYEGLDSRVSKIYSGKFYSVGDYVLTGGEIPALILVDSISRQIEGVLGNEDSVEEKRISSSKFFTRPEEILWNKKKYKIPAVLKSGDHKKIENWKEKNS